MMQTQRDVPLSGKPGNPPPCSKVQGCGTSSAQGLWQDAGSQSWSRPEQPPVPGKPDSNTVTHWASQRSRQGSTA